MKVLSFSQFGSPADVLKLEDAPTPAISDDQVLVRLTARSVNPSDVYTIYGTYGVRPPLPAVPGNEAAGVIERVGSNVTTFREGDRVTLMLGAVGTDGTWREYAAVNPQYLLPTPAALTDEQAACALVNYLTAWILAFEELDLQADEPLMLTAGASHLGRAMLQIAKLKNLQIVPTVRRAEQKQELLDLGANGVIVTDQDDLLQTWRSITGKKTISKAIDAVGGELGTAIINAMAPRGHYILYGFLGNTPLQIDGRLIFSEATIRGFWLVRWLQSKSPQHVMAVVGELSRLFTDGSLVPPVDSTVELTDLQGVIEHLDPTARHGKVVITGPRA